MSPSFPKLLPLLAFVCVLLIRWPVMLAHQDTWLPFEVHSGTIARALLDGVDLNVATTPIVAHIRGGVLLGVLLVPIYALLGTAAATMKLVPLLWNATAIALLVHVLRRYGSNRVAVVGALLFAFAPPTFQKLSTLLLASHMEAALPALLALLPYLSMTIDRRFSASRSFGFGAAVGFAGFFHLQALLPCLVLTGLLVAMEWRRLGVRHSSLILLGAALFAAPSFLFEGGAIGLLRSGMFAAEMAPPPTLDAPTSTLEKLGRLVHPDLRRVLEFGEIGAGGDRLGTIYTFALFAAALGGIYRFRRGIAAAAARVLGRDAAAPPAPVLLFIFHPLLVAALYARSSSIFVVEELGCGVANRHFAPLLFSLLALAAFGIGGGRRSLLLLVPLLVPGVAGTWAAMQSTEATRVPHRGECYEWFGRQLFADTKGDPTAVLAAIARVDRGDPRFTTFRFRTFVNGVPRDVHRLVGGRPLGRDDEPPAVRLVRLTAVGRQLAGARNDLFEVVHGGGLERLSPAERAALLHGVGIGLEAPRPSAGPEPAARFDTMIRTLLKRLPSEDARLVAEGHGFDMGFVFDPYNGNLRDLIVRQASFPADVQDAIYRGIAWGVRQRCTEPPTTVPDGLVVAALVPPGAKAAFDAGYTGAVMPLEASAFTASR